MISLSSRVTLASALVLTAFIALAALALEQAFEQSARSAMHERLFAQLYLVMAAAEVNEQGQLQMPPEMGEPRLNLPGSGLMARIGDGEGNVLWQSGSAIGVSLPAPAGDRGGEQFGLLIIKREEHFTASLAIEWQLEKSRVPLLFSVVETTTPFYEQMQRYRQTLWGWLGAMAVAALLTLLVALAWGLRPLRTVAAEVRAIENGEQQGLTRDYPKELKRLTNNINALLQHEHTQQTRYKNALGDLAHSLKTPLAILRGLDGGTQTQTLNEQVERMDSIVHYQLQRAATAGRSALATPVDVTPVVQRLVATLKKVHMERPLQLHTQVEENSRFRGDEGDLMELLGNLLDNAFKWAASTVWLTINSTDMQTVITVDDDGPGLTEEQAGQVLGRGVRLDETTPGHGIGLPMVRDIIESYGGKLTIGRSGHGGASITLTLPL